MRFLTALLATLACAFAPTALAQGLTQQQVKDFSPFGAIVYGVKLTTPAPSATSISLSYDKVDGLLAFAGGSVAVVSGPKSIAVPNQTVFGGTTLAVPVYVYAVNVGGAVGLCLSDLAGLTVKGSVATTNSGFLSCEGVTPVATSPLRLLGACTYANGTTITPASCATIQDRNLNAW